MKFTLFYCLRFGDFSDTCVFYTASALDILFFAWCALHSLSGITGYINVFTVIWFIMTILFWVVLIIAIINCIKYKEYKAGPLTQKIDSYLKWRLWALIFMILTGIVVVILGFAYGNGYGNWGISVLITLLINAIWIHSYTENFINICTNSKPTHQMNPIKNICPGK